MLGIRTQASWILITAFTVSALSELFRSTAKAGTSKYDSKRGLLTLAVPGYAAALALAVLVGTGWPWVTWMGLLVAVALSGVSILYYSPIMLPQRRPGPIDWLEDKRSPPACCSSLSPWSCTSCSARRWRRHERCPKCRQTAAEGVGRWLPVHRTRHHG